MLRIIYLVGLLLFFIPTYAQKEDKRAIRDSIKSATKKLIDSQKEEIKKTVDETKELVNESLDLGLKISKKIKQRQGDKKRGKAVFDGKKYENLDVEKKMIKTGSGDNLIFEEFYVLKTFQKPNQYAKDIYWYNHDADRISTAVMKDKETFQLMHGPYKKYLGEQILEEGWYYVGTKHARWEKYDKNFVLLDKMKYEKGFLADAEISYWDDAKTKIKEVIPMLYNKKTGDYVAFHETGTIATEGKYDNGVKTGRWVEYYPLGKKRKREIQYGKDFYDTAEPYTIREYDEKGKLTYEAPK